MWGNLFDFLIDVAFSGAGEILDLILGSASKNVSTAKRAVFFIAAIAAVAICFVAYLAIFR